MKALSSISIVVFLALFFSCKKVDPVPPVLSTTSISAITTTTAVSGGNVTDDGGTTVIVRGICWNTSDKPEISNNKTNDNSGIGSFISNITQLTPNTTYYVRAYATNSAGTGYGASVSFKTFGDKPALNSLTSTDILTTSASLSGTVNPNSLSTTVIFEYGLTTNYGSTSTPAQSPLSGDSNEHITVTLTALNPGKLYHFRIKAENSLGITYSEDMTFTTLGQVPSVTKLDETGISISSATLNCSVNPNYLPTTISFEWGIDFGYGNKLAPAQNSLDGSTSVNLSVVMTGLTEGTKYYYKISATNELGTTNSIGYSFTTFAKPIITTKDISEITTLSALSGGNIISDFGSSVSESGICWSTSHNPTISDNKVLSSLGGDNFSVLISGLTPNSTYYLRAYAINSVGIGYGDELLFRTYTGTVSDIDGNQYYTVTIGSQLWMAQNLKTTKYQNGALVGSTIPAQMDISGESNPKYQWAPGGNENNLSPYGRLYTWYALTDTRNICPLNWHVSSDTEWASMISLLGGETVGGGKLKEEGITHFASPNDGATNESGFTSLPSGYRNIYGLFGGITDSGQFWTTTEYNEVDAWSRSNWSGSTYVGHTHFTKSFGFSVRCIKD